LQDVDLSCLGHLKFPHPSLIKCIGKKFLDKYEAKKDEFLDQVLHKGGSWTSAKAEEIKQSEFYKQYIEAMRRNGTIPSLRGLMVCVDKIMPFLRMNNENAAVANYLLTTDIEMSPDFASFKRSRGASRRMREPRISSEDNLYIK
jgi:hypothetical protein